MPVQYRDAIPGAVGVTVGADGYTLVHCNKGAGLPTPYGKWQFLGEICNSTIRKFVILTTVLTLTAQEIAAVLSRDSTKISLAIKHGVSASHISRITPKLPPGPVAAKRKATRMLSETRKAYRTKLAKQVIAGRRSLESAAREAHCSTRTMYRYLCKLKK